jgi:hypothetical protein
MNERIKKLAEQAGGEFWQRLENDVVNPEAYITFDPPESLEKFAELIVLECAQVLETNGDNQRTIRMTESTGHNKTTDWMEGYEEAVKQYGGFLLKKNAKQIKQHFGVDSMSTEDKKNLIKELLGVKNETNQ